MDKKFPYHYRVPVDVDFAIKTPGAKDSNFEQTSDKKASRKMFSNGDELFQFTSKEYVDLFSTFEISIVRLD